MRTAAEIMKASLENTQRMQLQQIDAMRVVLEQAAKSAQLWSRFWVAPGQGPAAMMGQAQNEAGQLSERVRDAVLQEQQQRKQERKSA
jgi:hypothetical protein